MNLDKFPHWMQSLVGSVGGLGLFVVAFLDSSFISFPIINDLLVIHLSVQSPAWMPYYALLATAGSLAGCLVLYVLAKKGGELMFRRRAGRRAERIRGWIQRNAFLSVAIPALLPPPMPFKLFILAAGVFRVPPRTFIVALVSARGLRYLVEGVLAVQFGMQVGQYIVEHKLLFMLVIAALFGLSYLATRLAFRATPPSR